VTFEEGTWVIDTTNLYPTYRKPFDLIFIFATGKNEGWRAQGDDYRTFLGDFVASLSLVAFAAALAP
jgi:hypothetical protein